jgi:hypothetical protein
MAETLYDSGWVPQASGAINAAVNVTSCSVIRFIIAASGSGGTSASAGWSAGLDTPVPWTKNTPAYPVNPKITGTYALGTHPGQNTNKAYYIGVGLTGSGANHVDDFVPQTLFVNCAVSASSWGRVIIEGL